MAPVLVLVLSAVALVLEPSKQVRRQRLECACEHCPCGTEYEYDETRESALVRVTLLRGMKEPRPARWETTP